MASTERTRIAAKGWATRASRKLETLCDDKNVSLVELQDAADEFDNRLGSLDEAQSQVELELDIKDLEADIETAATLRDSLRTPRIRAAKILAASGQPDDKHSESNSASKMSVDVRLPKLELPSFSGNVLDWQTFWDQFEAIIDGSEIPTINKFTYLKSLLEGEAQASIQGLAMTSANYGVACKILKERFGRRERIVFQHIQDLLSISIPSEQTSVSILWKLNDDLQAHVRSLESLNVTAAQYGVILTPLILSRLPPDVRLEWARDGHGHEDDLEWLLEFLRKEIQRRERSQSFKEVLDKNPNPNFVESEYPPMMGSAAALRTSSNSQSSNSLCNLCQKPHPTSSCRELKGLGPQEVKDKIFRSGLCFRCLSKGHIARSCEKTCSRCQGRHHVITCHEGIQQSTSHANVSHIGLANTSKQSEVILQTARVCIRGEGGYCSANILFDTGSDRTYITKQLVEKIHPRWIETHQLAYAAFGNGQPSHSEMRNVVEVHLKGSQGDSHTVRATEVPVICASVYRPLMSDDVLQSFQNLNLVDTRQDSQLTIDMLIGLDSYWQLVQPGMVQGPDGLIAQNTVFGWMVSGRLESTSKPPPHISHQLLCLNDISESMVHSFWDLESLGIRPELEESVPDPVLIEFKERLRFVEGRYEVALPWKKKPKHLLNNEKLAKKRLDSLSCKLERDPSLSQRYNKVFNEMEASDIIEEVPLEEVTGNFPVYYMPHRPVVKEDRVTTKIRPVFDASAPSYNGVSLNDCMETGPSMIPNLPEILIRFRRWKIALTGDIEKAFLQVQVRQEDRDVHRFLLKDAEHTRIMRFKRVPFGNKSSPFLLNATIKCHLDRFPPSRVVDELSENLYVDDWLSGADSSTEACGMLEEAVQCLKQAGMKLSKWGSNSDQVKEMVYHEWEGKHSDSDSVRVLGLKWSEADDSFSFERVDFPVSLHVTKRVVLSFLARIYDPLGFLTPFTMLAKCLFQEIWKLNLGWDDSLPPDKQKVFLSWVQGFQELESWQIPRRYSQTSWAENHQIELHGFGDASERGYGACVYLRVSGGDDVPCSALIISKARVAPIKPVTLPRLELLGALLCARLVVLAKKALKLTNNIDIKCWTDSTVTLAWVRSDPGRWKTFVGNRVSQIHELTDPDCWNHCPGEINPADLLTRGISASELVHSSLWLKGPETLFEQGCVKVDTQEAPSDVMEELTVQMSLITVKNEEPILDIDRWSTFTRCVRVVAWMIRFSHNARLIKSERLEGELISEELNIARKQLFLLTQQQEFSEELRLLSTGRRIATSSPLNRLNPFLSEDGLLRIQGRLQLSDLSYDEKHPIILPKGHLSLLLVRNQHIILKHAGVETMITSLRHDYWVIGLRRLAKRVKRECVHCQRQDVQYCTQPMAPLPDLRVKQSPPFNVSGIDHAGPLYCCDQPGKKYYILLFTCAVTRAVHLELVESMSLDDTICAIRRFIARRGLPSVFYSDNGKSFTAAKTQLVEYYGHLSPAWRFIPPRSPWWGGWWERLVRSAKTALKKSIGRTLLTRTELETLLHEIEACINSRPLTFVGDDLDSGHPLTPSHFLLGRGTCFQPVNITEQSVPDTHDLALREEVQRELVDRFWTIWQTEYLRNLPPGKGSESRGDLAIGSIVLIEEAGYPRLKWPLGVVTKVFPGRDGVIRSVEVRTAKGLFSRSIQRVYDLEIHCPDSDFGETASETTSETASELISDEPKEMIVKQDPVEEITDPPPLPPRTTASGRRVIPRVRLDL